MISNPAPRFRDYRAEIWRASDSSRVVQPELVEERAEEEIRGTPPPLQTGVLYTLQTQCNSPCPLWNRSHIPIPRVRNQMLPCITPSSTLLHTFIEKWPWIVCGLNRANSKPPRNPQITHSNAHEKCTQFWESLCHSLTQTANYYLVVHSLPPKGA